MDQASLVELGILWGQYVKIFLLMFKLTTHLIKRN